jgi:alpha-mannosidase
VTAAEKRIERALVRRIRPSIHRDRWQCRVAAKFGESYEPVEPGFRWGSPWSTTWFRISADVPGDWRGRVEVIADLGFDDTTPGFQAEGLAYDASGTPIKGIFPRNAWIPVDGDGEWTCTVEAVAIPRLHEWPQTSQLGDRATHGSEPLYVLGPVELVLVDEQARALAADIEVLAGVMAQLAPADPRRAELLASLERAVDLLDGGDDLQVVREELAAALAAPARRLAPLVSAVGHAHIDLAWLWPASEAKRKSFRTLETVCSLAGDHPELVFACSQAQLWAWVKEERPALFERMKALVARGQIVPVGGMWVEADTNLSGGEALARQLVLGKEFFLRELGIETTEVWLPDCFGYSAALPQLIRLAGSTRFLTQKPSWNDTNRFPFHTFWWEGLDGSTVFTHLPPVDTYNAQLTPAELAFSVRDVGEQPPPTVSLVPFGFGDGGGGPTREMLERARRLADLDGAPRVALEAPAAYFERAEAEYADAPVWTGEIYLERHRGTYTNQVEIKQGNRRCEHLLREAELWAAQATLTAGVPYPYDELDAIWPDVLFNQFHDVLPGSSIAMANDDAVASYRVVGERLDALIAASLSVLAGEGDEEIAFNATPHVWHGVPALGGGRAAPEATTGSLDNGLLRVRVDETGRVSSLFDVVAGRELIVPGEYAAALQLHPDHPNDFDGWDLEPFYRNTVVELDEPTAIDDTGGAIRVRHAIGDTRVVQTLRLLPAEPVLVVETEVDWHEAHRLLKLAFPLDVHADSTSAEMQFGHVRRPLQTNTSWDRARFEFVAHRFLHVGEHGYGVAIVNDGIYGHNAVARSKAGGGRSVLARLSLIRGATFPDGRAEAGLHRFRCALVPGATLADAVREGYRFNLPLRRVRGAHGSGPLVAVDGGSVVVEAVKLAQDRSGDLVVRCYESLGARTRATLRVGVPTDRVAVTDLLERPVGDPLEVNEGRIDLELRPFQILTLRVAVRRTH